MLYNDRKLKKWQGFFLSEHSEQLKNDKYKIVEERDQQDWYEITQVLEEAFRNNKAVSIQLNVKENGLYKEDTVGTVIGFEEGYVYVGYTPVEIESIRNVKKLDIKKWYE